MRATVAELPPWYAWPDTGAVRTVRTAMGIPAVSDCVHLIAGAVSRSPVRTVDDDGTDIGPAPPFLTDATRMLGLLVTDYLLCGNAVVEPGPGWPPQRLDVLPAERCVAEGHTYALDPVRVRYGGRTLDLAGREVLLIRRDRHPEIPYRGWGVVEQHAEALGDVRQKLSYLRDSIDEGAVPSVAVVTPDPYLGQDSADEARARWKILFGRGREPGIFPKGTTVEPLAWSPTDAELTELRQADVADVARMFGLPPEAVGGPTGSPQSYANLQAAETRALRRAAERILLELEDTLSVLLPPNRRIQFERATLTRGTLQETAESVTALVGAGVPLANALELAGLPPALALPADGPPEIMPADIPPAEGGEPDAPAA